MDLTLEQKVNLLAIAVLESYGNHKPTQQQVELIERYILGMYDNEGILKLVSKIA